MTMQAWVRAGWLRAHDTQPDEVRHLWGVLVDDLRQAERPELGPEVRFEHAYNAALKCCLVALFAEGFRLGQVPDVHHTIIRSLPLVVGGGGKDVIADYLDACRERRDRLRTEHLTAADADALLEVARDLRAALRAWLVARHPALAVE